MKHIVKNMIPYWRSVLVILILLCLQAYCDLALPLYTSDIIDVGVINGGIEHIVPEKITEEEYERAQILMTDEEKELWCSLYEESDSLYVRKDLEEETLDAAEDTLLIPIVSNYQMGRMEESSFRTYLQKAMESRLAAADMTVVEGADGSDADMAAAMGADGSVADMTTAMGVDGSDADMAAAMESAGSTGNMTAALLQGSEDLSLEELSEMLGMEIPSFQAEDDDGVLKTYVDMRPMMQAMLASGMMDDEAMAESRETMEKTIEAIGSETLNSMGVQ
jgi:ATP-binding cassette subfamily B protein